MPYRGSWDPRSRQEYTSWLHGGSATTAHKVACAKLLAAFNAGILAMGPAGMTPHPPPIQRSNGNPVDLYCTIAAGVVARCFAVDVPAQAIRLLVIGPFNGPDLIDTARKRAANW